MKKFLLFTTLFIVILIFITEFYNSKQKNKNSPQKGIQKPQLVKIKIGYMPFTTNWPVFTAVEKGFFKEEGLDVELISFNSGPDAANALIKGEISSQVINTFSDLFNIETRSSGLYKIYALQQSSDKGHSETLLARSSSDIKTIEDLKGKKIGITPGSFTESLVKLAYKDKLDFSKDVTLVKLAPPIQLSSLESGQIDALLAYEPTVTIATEKNIAYILDEHPWKRVMEPLPIGAYTISLKTINEEPEIAKKIVRAMSKSIFLGRTNPKEAHISVVKHLAVPQNIVDNLHYLEDLVAKEIDAKSLEKLVNLYVEQGIIEKKVNVENLIYFLNDK